MSPWVGCGPPGRLPRRAGRVSGNVIGASSPAPGAAPVADLKQVRHASVTPRPKHARHDDHRPDLVQRGRRPPRSGAGARAGDARAGSALARAQGEPDRGARRHRCVPPHHRDRARRPLQQAPGERFHARADAGAEAAAGPDPLQPHQPGAAPGAPLARHPARSRGLAGAQLQPLPARQPGAGTPRGALRHGAHRHGRPSTQLLDRARHGPAPGVWHRARGGTGAGGGLRSAPRAPHQRHDPATRIPLGATGRSPPRTAAGGPGQRHPPQDWCCSAAPARA